MGARPSSFRAAGGGFLNNVDGVITGYRWTDEFNGVEFEPGINPKTGKQRFHSLFFELSVRLDGAEEDITQNLFAGDADAFDIAEDGSDITPNEDGYALGQGTPQHKFINTLCEHGFPETSLPEDTYNYGPIVGTRVRFAQEDVLDANGKPKKRVATKGKFKGKEFTDRTTVVAQVYELPAKAAKGAKGAKATVAVKTSKATKPAPADEEVEETLEDVASATLIALVTANKGKMDKLKLPMAILKSIPKHPQREEIRELLKDDDFLASENGWTYDAKKKVVTVDAE